jgi:hypothetical protein
MRILLITPVAEGEHHSYTASLAKAFSGLGHEVLHFSQNDEKSKKINQSITANTNNFKFLFNIYFKFRNFGMIFWQVRKQALEKWQFLFDHIHNLQRDSNRPDLLFFESLDASIGHYMTKRYFDHKLAIPFSGILVCPKDTRLTNKNFFRKGPFDPYNILKSRSCRSIGVLVEEYVPVLTILIRKPVIVLPDIVTVPGSIHHNYFGETILRRAGSRFIIGIWGSLSERKGINEFLQMSLNSPSWKYFFVMGGQINSKISLEEDINVLQQSLSGEKENLLISDRWLSDDELLSGMFSCDLIFAAYPDWRFSSGIIGHAAVVRVPILVNDGFVMAKRIKEFNIGFVKQKQTDLTMWVSDNIAAIKKLRNSSIFKEGCSKYCESYGYKQWCKSLAHLIEPQK